MPVAGEAQCFDDMAVFAAPMADHAALRQHMEHALLRFRNIHGICPGFSSNKGAPTHWSPRCAHPDYAGMLAVARNRSEEHTSELQSLMRISYAVFCLKK